MYACDLERIAAFYAALADLPVVSRQPDHVLLERDGHRITVVAVPPAIARTITISDPPERREDTALKLSFHVVDIAVSRVVGCRARKAATSPPRGRSWGVPRGAHAADGHDPEGGGSGLRRSLQPDALGTTRRS